MEQRSLRLIFMMVDIYLIKTCTAVDISLDFRKLERHIQDNSQRRFYNM
jgi:hypothetical protein